MQIIFLKKKVQIGKELELQKKKKIKIHCI